MNKLNGYNTYIGIIWSILFKILASKGLLVEGGDAGVNIDTATTLTMLAVSSIGDLYAMWGRLRATKPGPLARRS